jgi:hypothetical protein
MRRPLTTRTRIAACGPLALLAAGALAAGVALSAPAAPRGRASAATRAWRITLSAAPDDIALAQISFPGSRHARLTASSLHVAAHAPFGDDYMAAVAVAPSATPGALRALVLLVDRPSPLLDPVFVHLRATATRSLGVAKVRTFANPFTRSSPASRPALCDLRLGGAALAGSQLRELSSRGNAIPGFDAASAVAQAYDVICALPYANSFREAIERSALGEGTPAPPAPQPAPPSESGQPVGKLPGEGCKPTPEHACPG